MKKTCELCEGVARIHCESDQASLCWDCDAKVHSANFLVARHSRNWICHVCQSTTPFYSSGLKLRHVICVCVKCVHERICDRSCEEENEKGEEEYQLGRSSSPSPPPPSETSSSSDDEVAVSRKRVRIENHSPNLPYDFDRSHSSCQINIRTPPSRRRTAPSAKIGTAESGGAGVSGSGILDSLKRFHREETGSGSGSEMVKLFDLNSCDSF
ncbi:hypothetical protein ACJIZ3_010813 [Penstemon smallii]|uniref:B box-type domain-containing protein n=1 Tax=Penstemon smallii TaxID=265156 RepID=A0ABD3UHC6_9LAMI